jgi:L-amino acid N-acyltransferase YncA
MKSCPKFKLHRLNPGHFLPAHSMSSAYGSISVSAPSTPLPLPTHHTLKNGLPVTLSLLTASDTNAIAQLHIILNEIITEGKTYPQLTVLDLSHFTQYFLSHSAFVLTAGQDIIGGFYIKPNFPGRCSHICNGGFIVSPTFRRLGAATIMGKEFLGLAPLQGYGAAMFNLVFVDNEASLKLWRKLEFKEIGVVPNAGRMKDGDGEVSVDAIMFYYDFGRKALDS